jgi:hypothetical protein
LTKYQVIDVSVAQLKDLIRRSPELLENGLRYINHQIFTSRGLLDILMLDRDGSLVIIKSRDVEDDEILLQGIDYYDAAIRNLDGFARAYHHLKIDPGLEPRLFLVAPGFSAALQNRIKWLDVPVSLFTYQCIRIQDAIGEIIPVFKEITSSEIPEQLQIYDLGESYAPITEGDRILAQAVVGKIHDWDKARIVLEPTEYDISVKISGRVLCYVGPRKNTFMIYTNDSDGRWRGYPVHNPKDMQEVLQLLRTNYDKMRR